MILLCYLVSAIFVAITIFLTPLGALSNTSRWLIVGIIECKGMIRKDAAKKNIDFSKQVT